MSHRYDDDDDFGLYYDTSSQGSHDEAIRAHRLAERHRYHKQKAIINRISMQIPGYSKENCCNKLIKLHRMIMYIQHLKKIHQDLQNGTYVEYSRDMMLDFPLIDYNNNDDDNVDYTADDDDDYHCLHGDICITQQVKSAMRGVDYSFFNSTLGSRSILGSANIPFSSNDFTWKDEVDQSYHGATYDKIDHEINKPVNSRRKMKDDRSTSENHGNSLNPARASICKIGTRFCADVPGVEGKKTDSGVKIRSYRKPYAELSLNRNLSGSLEWISGSGGQFSGRDGQLSGRVGQLSGRDGQLSGRVGQLSGRDGQLSGRGGRLSGSVGRGRLIGSVKCINACGERMKLSEEDQISALTLNMCRGRRVKSCDDLNGRIEINDSSIPAVSGVIPAVVTQAVGEKKTPEVLEITGSADGIPPALGRIPPAVKRISILKTSYSSPSLKCGGGVGRVGKGVWSSRGVSGRGGGVTASKRKNLLLDGDVGYKKIKYVTYY